MSLRFALLSATLLYATVTPAEKNGKKVLVELDPYARSYHSAMFEGSQSARAVCVGNHKSFLGLYVYDRDGNCVAWDDLIASRPRSRQAAMIPDALAAEWFPPETGTYRVEVVNFGGEPVEKCDLVLK